MPQPADEVDHVQPAGGAPAKTAPAPYADIHCETWCSVGLEWAFAREIPAGASEFDVGRDDGLNGITRFDRLNVCHWKTNTATSIRSRRVN